MNTAIKFLRAMLTKEEIRSKILVRLKTQKEDDRDRKSKVIKNKLFRNPVFKKAKIVMFYISIGGEVDT
ncbi:MAG: 5-formyltetrahydrofolate cyclo-ligase, partial [Candidatus Omnitrophota bacterium]